MRGHHVGNRDSTLMKESPLSKCYDPGSRITELVSFLVLFAGRASASSRFKGGNDNCHIRPNKKDQKKCFVFLYII